MSGTAGGDLRTQESESSFVWEDASNLYFHASSGFYHDPNAGWYYSSRDGLYYTFENGAYVPLTFDKTEESETQECATLACSEPVEINQGNKEQSTCDVLENHCPPSEWLEEALIDIYLSGHSNLEVVAKNSASLQSSEGEQRQVTFEGSADQVASDKLLDSLQVEQVKEEWISEDVQDAEMLTDRSYPDASLDEEKWHAQYGQVVRTADVPKFPAVDLWDWELVVETVKKRQVTRLFGKLVRPSSKLHPSVPSGGGRLKTASIRDVHLDLVRVASGKVYRLRTPNKRYLAALSAYDSSNPTRDWSFPDLLENVQNIEPNCFNGPRGIKRPNAESSGTVDAAPAFQMSNSIPYRDRASERRYLHGEYGIGPGQKNCLNTNLYEEESTSRTSDPEEAAAEALNMTFGKGSYARKLLERMGWKDGEALGSSTKGILEPIQAVANKGNAGGLVRDANVTRKLIKFIEMNMIGVSKDSRLRAAKIMTVSSDGYELPDSKPNARLFDYGRKVLAARWEILREVCQDKSMLSLPEYPLETCTSMGRRHLNYQAFAWLKCTKDEIENFAGFLKENKIPTRSGKSFVKENMHARINTLDREDASPEFGISK